MKVSDQIRHVIENCGLTRYRIAKEAGISQSTLSRFMAGHAMSTEVLDRLTELLGLSISMTRPRRHVVALGSRRARWSPGKSGATNATPPKLDPLNGRPINPKLFAANEDLPIERPVIKSTPNRSNGNGVHA
ncbi:MAG: helix-turn-helix transcriptional regulator [Planctomycetota bacterium]